MRGQLASNKRQAGDVVELVRGPGESRHVGDHLLDTPRGVQAGEPRQSGLKARVAIEFTRFVDAFGHAVGEQKQAITRREVDRRRCDGPSRRQPERRATVGENPDGAIAVDRQRRIVAAIGVFEAPAVEVEDAETAALMNTNVYQVGNLVLNPPRTRVYVGTSFSLASAAASTVTYTTVSMTSVTVDSDGMFSSSSPTVLTVATPGLWLVGAQVQFQLNTAGQRGLKIFQNSTNLVAALELPATNGASGTPGTTLSATGTYEFVAGDTISMAIFQNSQSSVTINSGVTYLWATWLGS